MAAIAAIVAHGATGFLYLASPLVAPWGGVAVLGAGWVLLLVAALRIRRDRPWLTLLVPVVSVAYWVAVLSIGESLFDWTA